VSSKAIIDEILTKPFSVSDEQRDAILSDTRYTRVIAGAGAGKTETITRRIAYLLVVKSVEPGSIVAFTFTDKAAQSMKNRIYQRVEQLAGSAATAKLSEMYIGTIHSYAKQVLDDYFGYGNYAVLDENQEMAYLMREGHGLRINKFGRNYADACREFLRTVNMVQSELLDENNLAINAPDFFNCYRKYLGLLNEHRQLTFGRMISEAVRGMEEAPETLSHVKHLIVDEYQDINRAQQEFIRLIGGHGSIYVVGDPRQSIYQWRGSDQSFFEKFMEIFPGAKTFNITINRRSAKNIVLNANVFSSSFKTLTAEPMSPSRTDDGFVGIACLKTPEDEARWIANQIEIVLNKQQLNFSDIGVLTRSVSTSATPLINELRRRSIPYIVGGKVGLFKRDEAQALGRIFTWFWEDGFWVPNPWRWSTQIQGDDLLTSALELWGAAQSHGVPSDAADKLREIKANLCGDGRGYRNFSQIYQDVLVAIGFHNLDFTDRSDAAVMANLGRFNNLLTDYETANRIGGRKARWKRDLRGLCWFMNSYGLRSYAEQPSEDVRSVDAVQVMTIHQAKGLEWPIVFVFGLTDNRFPPNSVGREANWCGVPRSLFDAERYEGTLEDERRLFYVAITRPRDALVLSYFRKMKRSVRRSRFLQHIVQSNVVSLGSDSLPGLVLMPQSVGEGMRTFGATEIVGYNRCPYMYLLRELWGYQPGFVPEIDYGPALHYCLRVAGELIRREGLDPRTAVATAVDENFHMAFVSGVTFNKLKDAANRTLTEFADEYGDDLTKIEEVEYRLEFPLQEEEGEGVSATIMGRIDVLLRDMDKLEVRDYKTAVDDRSWPEAEKQVRLYALGLRSMERNVTKGSVADLAESIVEPVEITDASLSEARAWAESLVKRIVERDFKPCPGNYCDKCDYSSICKWSVA